MKNFVVLTGIALSVAISGPISAHANLLTNGGLEVTSLQLQADPTLMSSDNLVHASPTLNSNALAGWTIGGNSIDIVPNYYWANVEGTYSIDLIGTTGIGSISQTVTGLIPGNTYELGFDFSVNPSDGGGGESAFARWLRVDVTNSTLPTTFWSGTVGTRTVVDMQYIWRAFDFTATDTTSTITFSELFPAGLPATFSNGSPILPSTLYAGVALDNIDLESLSATGRSQPQIAAPEPASLGLLGFSGLMLLRRRSAR